MSLQIRRTARSTFDVSVVRDALHNLVGDRLVFIHLRQQIVLPGIDGVQGRTDVVSFNFGPLHLVVEASNLCGIFQFIDVSM